MDGFYNLEFGDICRPCMDNAECPGGSEIKVLEGYWRDNLL